jgi:hypothetical protein
MFLYWFPLNYLLDVLLVQTNERLKDVGRQLSLGELLRWIGLWFYMSTFKGYSRSDFFSSKPIDDFDGAPVRLNQWMSRNRFQQILNALFFTDRDVPAYVDKFFYIRQLIESWNQNMNDKFLPSWISCLDESMSAWLNRWTCPGWVFCPRKPHPFGNEYHSMCCGESGIMYRIEMVEGKDRPTELPIDESKGKTVSLLLRFCNSIAGRGMVVILDSGFCVLKGLIELRKIGVYASAVIKKRRYWPRYINGEYIDNHMNDKEIGATDCLNGVLDGWKYNVFAMKDVDYTMKLMSTYGMMIPTESAEEKKRTKQDGSVATFKYIEPFDNHYRYRHAVDDHNNLRHSGISIEETWMTKRWECRVFAFILAITEVNIYLAFRYFVWSSDTKHPTLLQFRKDLAKALIYNEHLPKQDDDESTPTRRSKRQKAIIGHGKETAPIHAKNFVAGRWELTAKDKYQRYTCKAPECSKRCRTYCICSPGHWLCDSCINDHCIEVVKAEE